MKVLGSTHSIGATPEADVEQRIAQAWSAFWRLRPLLCNRTADRLKRLRLLHKAIPSTLLWGACTWNPSTHILQRLQSTQREMERKVLQLARRPEELRSEYFERAARVGENLAGRLRVRPWATIFLERYWSMAEIVANRPLESPDARLLAMKGPLWRHTLRGAAESARQAHQGHQGRVHPWRWDWWLDHFHTYQRQGECWALAADHDRGVWQASLDDWLGFRLQGFQHEPRGAHGGRGGVGSSP